MAGGRNCEGSTRYDQAVVLVAGDNPNDLNNISTYLREEGFGTITVLDRATIITIARSERPDLVLLDFDECLDVCRKLKPNFVTEPIPVIALLFPAEEADRVAVLELGADDCMAKPYSRRELLLRIRGDGGPAAGRSVRHGAEPSMRVGRGASRRLFRWASSVRLGHQPQPASERK
jgi:DNA-binding response OmpR family regulator